MPFSRSKFRGFPFETSDYDSHDHIQSRLDDIAQRHPEFAGHLRFDDFPSLRRKRYGSGGSDCSAGGGTASGSGAQASPEARSRFPFNDDPFTGFPFTDEFKTTNQNNNNSNNNNNNNKPPEVPRNTTGTATRRRKQNPYLPQHLSNTVDLGVKQEPVDSARSQRSMSAPPDNRTAATTAPPPTKSEQESVAEEQQQQQQQSEEQPPTMGKSFSRQPKERIIPIQVEGRDEPVLPKNPNITPKQNTEKVFGNEHVYNTGFPQHGFQRPSNQFHRQFHSNAQPFDQFAKQHVPKQQQQQQPPPSQKQQQTFSSPPPPPSAAQARQQEPQQQEETASPPPPQPQQYINDPLEKIKTVRSEVMDLMTKVEQFRGTRKDREYLYLDEMLTRNLLKLDDVETEGKENIRVARKEAIKCIQTCINNLEARAQAKEKETRASAEKEVPTVENMESEKSADQQQSPSPQTFKSHASLVISGVPKPGVKSTTEPEAMEIDPSSINNGAVVALPPPAPQPVEITTAVLVETPAVPVVEAENKTSQINDQDQHKETTQK